MHLCSCWKSMTELQIDSRHLASPLPALKLDSFTLNQTPCLKGLRFSESKIHFFPNYVRLQDCSYFIKRECTPHRGKGQQLIPLVTQLAPEDPLIQMQTCFYSFASISFSLSWPLNCRIWDACWKESNPLPLRHILAIKAKITVFMFKHLVTTQEGCIPAGHEKVNLK